MSLRAIVTPHAPAAIGPYSQAVAAGGFLYVAGQLPMDPATGKLVEGDIRVQTARVLDNLAAILTAAGSSFDHVVKTEVFMIDLTEFATMNEVYATRFSGAVRPARQAIQAARLPRDAKIEISCIAWLG